MRVTAKMVGVKPTSANVTLDGRVLRISFPPYLLALALPGTLVEDSIRVEVDPTSDYVCISAAKADLAAVWDVSGAVTTLLERSAAAPPLPPDGAGYGFAGQFSGVFDDDELTCADIVDPNARRPPAGRAAADLAAFCGGAGEHYSVDSVVPAAAERLLAANSPARQFATAGAAYTADECAALLRLPPPRPFPLLWEAPAATLVELLCAIAYECRVSSPPGAVVGVPETSSEADWALWRLAASACGLVQQERIGDAVAEFVRRVCIYPLVRNFNVACQCVRDAAEILRGGRVLSVRALLWAHAAFASSAHRGKFATILTSPAIHWVQSLPARSLAEWADVAVAAIPPKELVPLPLAQAEAYGAMMAASWEAGAFDEDS